ncbi:hypothetical protein AQUCO_04700034v1 [Aquilegia coerulea]|uniref:F-box associated beta-propeller type 3 domain-containing protein n=1 Tax=Aquilegia coerulea TaxID=218851 RepID=A0A2G5CKT7_AQUCA|nr:hypothetical protein AQUCO_04700034v1 [Aquilegia coerulea]
MEYEILEFSKLCKSVQVSFHNGKTVEEPPINGLLFYAYPTMKQGDFCMCICDPAIRDYVKLPIYESFKSKNCFPKFGFGFDTISKEFKVVAISLWNSDGTLQSEAQVYTLGSNSWKRLTNVPKVSFIRTGSAFVNGSLHWLATGETEDGLELTKIMSFNLSSEHFGVIPSPAVVESKSARSFMQLVELRGCLSIVDYFYDRHTEIC